MTAPLNPDEAALARITRPLTVQEKRNLLSGRSGLAPGTGPFRFQPGLFGDPVKAPEGPPPAQVEAPEPDNKTVGRLLVRLETFLVENGIELTQSAIERIRTADRPFAVLKQFITDDKLFDIAEFAVRQLAEDEWRIGFIVDFGRAGTIGRGPSSATRAGTFEGSDDARQYSLEYNRLVETEGLSPFQAAGLLKEWGFNNPLIPGNDLNTEVEALAEKLAVMRATGEYTGDLLPEDLLFIGSIEGALQLLEDSGYEGSLADFDEFQEIILAEAQIGDTIQESATAAVTARDDRPPLPEDTGVETRVPIGVPADFVARSAPRPPGRLRGTSTRPGLDPADARAAAASGARGRSLAGFGTEGIEQDPEYFEGDQYNIMDGLSFEQTMLYQTMLVDAGWLDPDDFDLEQGFAQGFETALAMARAMTVANRSAEITTWVQAAQLSAVEREKNLADAGSDEPVPVWTPGIYLAPDPDFLSQVVKTTFRGMLGREPSNQEVRALAGSLSGEFRGVFDVEEEKALAEFEQNLALREASLGPLDPATGERTPVPLEEGETFRTVEPGIESLTGIDPIASFQERFEARFAEELSRGRQREVNRDARRDIMGSIFATDAAVGGGR